MSESQPTAPTVYRPIEGFPGYRVGADGTVQSNRTRGGRIVPWRDMSLQTDGVDRFFVGLRRGGRIHRKPVHHLVLETFIGPRPPGLFGCHQNDNHRDNRATNLYWGTQADNCADRERNGHTAKGEREGTAKLTEAQVIEIRRTYAAGEADQYQLAERFGVGQSTIGRVVRRTHWKHV